MSFHHQETYTMTRPRVQETDSGIQGEFNVTMYDHMQKTIRDRGWIQTGSLLKNGITQGCALEIGPGPGYLGLEWLKHTQGTTLKGLDISADMIALAEHNAGDYGLSQRVEYVHSSGSQMPFDDGTFDAVFTNGSLHEWSEPRSTFDEIWRLVRPGGKVLISDLRRDIPAPIRWFLWIAIQPREMRPGLVTSLNAAYISAELRELVKGTGLERCTVSEHPFGLVLVGDKHESRNGNRTM
jgi:ubiquinone/menaquinone biosynthesis C-methylase UbiE